MKTSLLACRELYTFSIGSFDFVSKFVKLLHFSLRPLNKELNSLSAGAFYNENLFFEKDASANSEFKSQLIKTVFAN